jgi:integrase
MPRKAKELGPLEVARLRTPGLHAVGNVAGLYLQVLDSGARSWVLRMMIGDKRRDMGLGGYPDVTLAQARQKAQEKRDMAREGRDPIEERRAARSALRAAQAKAVTFKEAAGAYIEAHESGWRNAKHAQQWRNTLETYAYPKIGALLTRDVDLAHVLSVLEPIWRTKTETASRLRSRVELVLDWATARGYREGLNPARWRGHLDKLLPRPSKLSKIEHHAALSVSDVGAFMQLLREQGGMGARALEFTILTAARSGEVRGATWAEFDLEAGVWIVPGERMKAGKEHRVPLSAAAVKVLKGLPRMAGTTFAFPAPRGGQLSDMTLTAVLRRMEVNAVPHGFRSTFRDWASERTNYPSEMAEMALAHTIGDKVEAAYRRGDMFEKRRRMMDDWARYCAKPQPKGEVIPMKRKRG